MTPDLPARTTVHEPDYYTDTSRSVPMWYWKCTCRAWTLQGHRSRALAELDYELEHRYPDLRHARPEHTVRLTEGGFGGPGWTCSCYSSGRPEGYQNERRALQAWQRHVTETTVLWVRAVHRQHLERLTPEQRDERRRRADWLAKSEEERARQAKFVLDQIL
jgi:hypothetical protein